MEATARRLEIRQLLALIITVAIATVLATATIAGSRLVQHTAPVSGGMCDRVCYGD